MLIPVLRLSMASLTCGLALTAVATTQEIAPPDDLSVEGWSGIHDAYETQRYATLAVEGGFEARNPGQRWGIRFDRRGFSVDPDAGGWSWGLELESYGFAGQERAVIESSSASAAGKRITYEWDSNLEEWYVNDGRGLEHGYTIHRRPARAGEGEARPLTFTLTVRGSLRPEVSDNRRGVSFLKKGGETALTYTGLCAFDADGRELEASFEQVADQLVLSVDEHGARYPLTIDPIAQEAYLKASNTGYQDNFGWAVAMSGETIVIGAYLEDSNATGVDGDQQDDSATDAGAVYVFVRNGTTWSQEAYLKASNTDAEDWFGYSVAISGDTLVVGAPWEDSMATGVNGDQTDNSRDQAGAAYVFTRSGTTWTQEAYLKASNTGAEDSFGHAVAIDGDSLVIGASYEDSVATGVNGDQSNNSAQWAGAAYAFVRSGTTWAQEAYLKASNTDPLDGFGRSVAISGATAVVGAEYEEGASTGVNGDQSDNSAHWAGAAYVFVRGGAGWSQQAYVKASNSGTSDFFSQSVSIWGDTLVVGANGEKSTATGINGNQSSNTATNAGAAYLYERSGVNWSQKAYIKASNTESYDHFGRSVSVTADTLLIGATHEDSGATGVNGNQADNSTQYAGAAYLFVKHGPNWSQQAYLKASNTGYHDHFGCSVAVSGNTAVIGARGEYSNATGVNGDQHDDSLWRAGAAYVFDLNAPEVGVAYCSGDPGSGTPCPCNNDNDGTVPGSGCDNGVFGSGAKLVGSGTPSVTADTLVLTSTHLEPSDWSLYFQAENDLSPGLSWGDGLRCAGGNLKRIQTVLSDTVGTSRTTIKISTSTGNILPGDTKYYQCWYRTTINPPCGPGVNEFNSTNGYVIIWVL